MASVVPITTGFANSSFNVTCKSGRRLVLTVLDNHDERSAQRLVALTDWLVARGVRTPAILRDEDDLPLQRLDHSVCIMRPFQSGVQPEWLSREQVGTVGSALASIHQLGVPSGLGLPSRRLPLNWRSALTSAPSDLVALVEEADDVFDPHSESFVCLLHGDLFPDNMIWDDAGLLHILDWETASIDCPDLDLGFTLVGLTGGGPLGKGILESLLSGYDRNRTGEHDEVLGAARYACAVLAFQRYSRHVLRYPNREKTDFWRELMPFAKSLDAI